jgi:PilZ domain.
MIDLSSDGVGLWSSKAIAVGEQVEVSIPQGRFRSIELPATVATCRPAAADAWRLGVHFFRRLTGEELAAALS